MQCINRIRVEVSKKENHQQSEIRAQLGIDNTAPVTVDNRFLFEASWESFEVEGGERVEVYDWSIAKHKDGSEMVLNWTRIEAGLIDTIQVQHISSRNV